MSTLARPTRCLPTGAVLLAALLLVPLTVGLLLGLRNDVGGWARHQVPLSFSPRTPSAQGALVLYAHNLRVAATPLLGALLLGALRRHGRTLDRPRALLDVFLAFSAISNAALLALSVAGYGLGQMAPWLPQLPFEFGAIALALTIYLAARHRTLDAVHLISASALCGLLLAIAAALETYAVPQA